MLSATKHTVDLQEITKVIQKGVKRFEKKSFRKSTIQVTMISILKPPMRLNLTKIATRRNPTSEEIALLLITQTEADQFR